jgi:hypothetical protein
MAIPYDKYAGETLLVLLDEENGIYEEMASRLDAPDMSGPFSILTAVINPVRFLKERLSSI